MLEKLELLKERVNGPDKEMFCEEYYGRFFTGDIELIFDKQIYTLFFHEGKLEEISPYAPIRGEAIGVSGSMDAWNAFFAKPNFGYALLPMNPNHLSTFGPPLTYRQNYNVLACLCRILAKVV